MDIKSIILTKIRTTLTESESKFQERNLEPIQCVDIDYGQVQNPEKFDLYTLPAVFIQTTLQRQQKRKFTASVRVLFAVNTPSYSDDVELLSRGDIPLFHYQYQSLLRELIEGIEELGLEFISDEEMDIEAVQFVATQTYQMDYEEMREDEWDDYNLQAENITVFIGRANVVETIKD